MNFLASCKMKTSFISVFAILFVVNAFLNLNAFSSDFFTLFIVFLFFAFLIVSRPVYLLRYPFLWFASVTNILGVFIIENTNIFLSELDVSAYHKNSLSILALAWYFFHSVIYLLDIYKESIGVSFESIQIKLKFGKHNIDGERIILWSCLFILTLFFIRVFPHPFFIEHVDRFLYEARFLTVWEKRFIGYLSYFVPIIVYCCFARKSPLAFSTLILFLILKFWTGEKFGFYFDVFCFVCIYFSGKLKINFRSLLSYIPKIGIILVIFMLVLLSHRTLLYHSSINSNFKYLVQRIAQNGQLWWAMYDTPFNLETQVDELDDEVNSFFKIHADPDYNSGIYKIMQKTTPTDIFWKKVESKSRYAYSTYASIYYYFSITGVIFYSVLSALLYWILTHYIIYSFKNGLLVDLIVCGKLFKVANSTITQSDFNTFFSFQVIFCVGIILLLNLFRSFLAKMALSEKV